MPKLRPLSKIRGEAPQGAPRRSAPWKAEKMFDLLMLGQQYWHAMGRFRWERDRNKRYLYGDQWGDKVLYDGMWVSESLVIAKQGNVPLKNNLIRRLVNSVNGLNINQDTEPTVSARDRREQKQAKVCSTLLQQCMQENEMDELRVQEFEEFLMSGLVVEHKWAGDLGGKNGCWTYTVQPNNIIMDNNMADPRGWDCNFIGEIHDVSLNDILFQLAKSPAQRDWFRNIYAYTADWEQFETRWTDFGYSPHYLYDSDFFMTADNGRCRVIEIWRKEPKERYRCHDWLTGEIFKVDIKDAEELVVKPNNERLAQAAEMGMPREEVPLIEAQWCVDTPWVGYYLSPFGDVLWSGESEYAHGGHPYAFKAYPFIDGEIHSFVNEVIDQQRFINRLIIMNDMAVRSSAKGLMMVPVECIPPGMSQEEFAKASTSYNGVLYYVSKNVDKMPTVITSNSTNIGTTEILQMEMKMMEDISGVHGALQGKAPTAGTSGTLYAQEAQNASTTLVGMLVNFSAFVKRAAFMDMKNILQFYDDKKIMAIAGELIDETMTIDKIRNLEWDMSIQQSQVSAVYRENANQFLMQLWQSGQITLPMLLEHGHFPAADELLQDLQVMQQEQAQQQQQVQTQEQGQQPQQAQVQQAQVQQAQGPSAER